MRARLLWAALAAATGCSAQRDAAGGCPSVDFIEALHAATFHFEHGAIVDARSALSTARRLAAGPLDATAREALRRLGLVERALDPDQARGELESMRSAFADWRCLPEPLHRRFHAKLPPLR